MVIHAQFIPRADKYGRCRGLDDRRACQPVPGQQAVGGMHRHIRPARCRINEGATVILRHRLAAVRAFGHALRCLPFDAARGDGAQCGDQQFAIGLDMAEAPFVIGLERLTDGGPVKCFTTLRYHSAQRPLLPLVAQVEDPLDLRLRRRETFRSSAPRGRVEQGTEASATSSAVIASRSPSITLSRSSRTSDQSIPSAQKAPACTGTKTRSQPSARATATPCIGPAPPPRPG